MFNFLDPKLCPKVLSTAAATDHYEVENLISANYSERVRGFIAYPIIKPPIEINFDFICPVNIHYIVLNTTVGSQRSSGIEIFAKFGSTEYTSICKASFDEAGVVFCNSKKYSRTNLPPNVNSSYHVAFFKSNTFKLFLNAEAIRVVIFRLSKRNSIPCLSSIQVWGIPSSSCSSKTVETINKLITRADVNTTFLQKPENMVTDEFIIPEEFKDDLTYEIMTIPMTLPSGKTVDQSTLDKHIESEIKFGRKPCDPFTGLKFDSKTKPVLNVGLKTRIDMFLLANSHRSEFFNLNRTVGAGRSKIQSSNKRVYTSESTDDIDVAITKAKHSCDFVSFSDNPEDNSCERCTVVDNALYKVPCSHFFCRSCLLSVSKDMKCSKCDTTFRNSEVIKCNF